MSKPKKQQLLLAHEFKKLGFKRYAPPATQGEWTVKQDSLGWWIDAVDSGFHDGGPWELKAKAIVNSHNAALAAERKVSDEFYADMMELREQLAAEKAMFQRDRDAWNKLHDTLREQLADYQYTVELLMNEKKKP